MVYRSPQRKRTLIAVLTSDTCQNITLLYKKTPITRSDSVATPGRGFFSRWTSSPRHHSYVWTRLTVLYLLCAEAKLITENFRRGRRCSADSTEGGPLGEIYAGVCSEHVSFFFVFCPTGKLKTPRALSDFFFSSSSFVFLFFFCMTPTQLSCCPPPNPPSQPDIAFYAELTSLHGPLFSTGEREKKNKKNAAY